MLHAEGSHSQCLCWGHTKTSSPSARLELWLHGGQLLRGGPTPPIKLERWGWHPPAPLWHQDTYRHRVWL